MLTPGHPGVRHTLRRVLRARRNAGIGSSTGVSAEQVRTTSKSRRAPAAMKHSKPDVPGSDPVSTDVLALGDALRTRGADTTLFSFTVGSLVVEVREAMGSVWAIARRSRYGGVAHRCVHIGEPFMCRQVAVDYGEVARLEIASPLGIHLLVFTAAGPTAELFRVLVRFSPGPPLPLPCGRGDIYPLGTDDDPLSACGAVIAAQCGVNVGMVYFRLTRPFSATSSTSRT